MRTPKELTHPYPPTQPPIIGRLTQLPTPATHTRLTTRPYIINIELGKLVKMTNYFRLYSNKVRSPLPSHLPAHSHTPDPVNGDKFASPSTHRLPHPLHTPLTLELALDPQLCDDVPSEVQALSSGVSNWKVTTDNSIGTACPTPSPVPNPTTLPPTPKLTALPTSQPTMDCPDGFEWNGGTCSECGKR